MSARAAVLVLIDPGVRLEHPWIPEVCPAGAVIGPDGDLLFVHPDGRVLWVTRGGSRGTKATARGGGA